MSLRINNLTVKNFQRIGALAHSFTDAPVHLFTGPNEAGKSTIRDAIEFALRGASSRVSKKKDFHLLVTLGAKSGAVDLQYDGDAVIHRNVKDGKAKGNEPELTLPAQIALGMTSFAALDTDNRRALLFDLLDMSADREQLAKELLHGGPSEKAKPYVEGIREAIWRVSDDAVDSVPGLIHDAPEAVRDELRMIALVEEFKPLLTGDMTAALGECQERLKAARARWSALTGERYGTKKAPEFADTVQWPDLETLRGNCDRAEQVAADKYTAMEEAAVLASVADTLHEQRCPQCEHGLAVNSDLTVVSDTDGDAVNHVDAASNVIALREAWEHAAKVNAEADAEYRNALQKAENYQAAIDLYNEVIEPLQRLEEQLLPDGVPGKLLALQLAKLNERLATLRIDRSQPIRIRADMEIERADGFVFGLLSEAAQWMADFALKVTIAQLAGIQTVIADRMDVLEPARRIEFVGLLESLIAAMPGTVFIVMATMKEAPEGLPEFIESRWLGD